MYLIRIQYLDGEIVSSEVPYGTIPRLAKFIDTDVVLLVDDDNKLMITHMDKNMMLEVLPEHHGLPQIDQISLGNYRWAFSEFRALLFSYDTKTVVLADFNVTKRTKLNWCITKVIKLEVPETINFIAVNFDEEIMFIVDSQGVAGVAYVSKFGSRWFRPNRGCVNEL